MNDKTLSEFLPALDANVMYCIQQIDKLREDMALTKRYAMVAAKRGTLWEIGGYVYGRTSQGDPYILLYPAHPKMKQKVTRVYQHQFSRLPYFIETNAIPADAQDGNPDKEKAIQKRIYNPCPEFTIATRDGKESNMGPEKRFFITVEAPGQHPTPMPESISPAFPPPSTEPETTESAPKPTDDLPDPVSISNLNSMLGLGESDPDPHKPYSYKDGTPVNDNELLQTIFYAHWQVNQRIPENGLSLQSWYKRNKSHLQEKGYIQ